MELSNLSAQALNESTPLEAALALTEAYPFLRFVPVCSSDHTGMSEQHVRSCSNPGKAPLITNWPIKASRDPAVIAEWFSKWSNANLAILTGSKGGIIAVDNDGEYGRAKWNALFNGHPPVTWRYTTPNNGERFLFRAPQDRKLGKYRDPSPDGGHEELAILTDKQMANIPPSVLQSGPYQWIDGFGPGDVALADAPQEVLDLVINTAASLFAEPEASDEAAPASGLHAEAPHARPRPSGTQSATGEASLNVLAKSCPKVARLLDLQLGAGCDEETWFLVYSMLVSAGHTDAALAFSRLSQKHDFNSESKILNMAKTRDNATYGPTRCTSFGCDSDQIRRCFGDVRTNNDGDITNSPATFLKTKKGKAEQSGTAAFETKAALLPQSYSIHGKHLCLGKPDKDGKIKRSPLANFFAWINKDVEKDDGAERVRYYEIEGIILSTHRPLSPILVPALEFEGMKWIPGWGPEPNIMPGPTVRDTVRHAIQSTASAATKDRIFSHLGWRKLDDRWAYLHAGGAIGASGVRVELDPRLKNYALPASVPDVLSAMRFSLKLLDIAPTSVTYVLWALVYLSVLCEWLRLLHIEPKFLVWLHGYTGSYKTSISKVFLCHFGNLLEHPPASFKDTANSVEKRSSDAKDTLLLIDDYHPTSSIQQAKAMASLAEQILRGYGDRVGRGRQKQDMQSRRDYVPRGMAVVTAEDVLTVGSSVARLFPVELQRADVDLGKLREAQRNAPALAEAMAGYVAWVGHSMNEGNGNYLTDLFEQLRDEAVQLNVHGRLVEAACWLYVGLHSGLSYAVSVGALTPERMEGILSEGWDTFLRTAKEQGDQVEEVRPTTRFIELVAELLASGAVFTRPVKPSSVGEVTHNGTHVGWHDDNYYYFLPKVLYNHVCKFLSMQGMTFPVTDQTLWAQLADEGIIEPGAEKENEETHTRNTRRKEINGDRTRKLWVKAKVLRSQPDQDERQPRERQHRPHTANPNPGTADLFTP